jgi:hypothetical protein
MSEVNEGVGIILARMETHPEEFFGMGETNGKWRWIFSESLREVMTEPEKAALHTGMTKVRRLEITHRAIGAIIPHEEEDEDKNAYGLGRAIPKAEGGTVKYKAQGRYNP